MTRAGARPARRLPARRPRRRGPTPGPWPGALSAPIPRQPAARARPACHQRSPGQPRCPETAASIRAAAARRIWRQHRTTRQRHRDRRPRPRPGPRPRRWQPAIGWPALDASQTAQSTSCGKQSWSASGETCSSRHCAAAATKRGRLRLIRRGQVARGPGHPASTQASRGSRSARARARPLAGCLAARRPPPGRAASAAGLAASVRPSGPVSSSAAACSSIISGRRAQPDQPQQRPGTWLVAQRQLISRDVHRHAGRAQRPLQRREPDVPLT